MQVSVPTSHHCEAKESSDGARGAKLSEASDRGPYPLCRMLSLCQDRPAAALLWAPGQTIASLLAPNGQSFLLHHWNEAAAAVSVEACVAHFPYARPRHPSSFEYVLGPRLSRDWSVGNKHHTATIHYADNLLPLEAVRANARGLQEILCWSTQMAEGSCPEVSSWDAGANDDRYYVDRRESLYRLVIPGAEQSSFYFECSLP